MIKAATILAAPEEHGANPLIPHTYELVVGIFSFLVVLFVVGKILVPRIQKTLAERTDAIEGGIKRAEEAQAEAQALQQQYRDQLAEARHEAARLREEAREQAAQIKAELREEAQAEARRLVEAAHAQIEADRQAAFAQLRTEIGRLSTDLAGRIVGESLEDEARQSRIVDRFLDELEGSNAQAVR
ncbi:F-type H+-transporting ATPase subunit b [Nonomuraea maritima]|jgi:F-type H+-transporting ATPase subunit b|uniref:ATP synthase subunit b n=1 Tax=Nonomuraea maritima TaxID=683260 RepID=A0A1G8ZDF6_9ACTN|nr:F0F1 ATP synthase subunit B [Nonomuraea maritima]SDK13057.1 F-type H+-transporting ATPase subunit b [Nonomuraea maritima]